MSLIQEGVETRPVSTHRVTIWVERVSGYVAGHCKTFAAADDLAERCNVAVPGDPARVRWVDNVEAWKRLGIEEG